MKPRVSMRVLSIANVLMACVNIAVIIFLVSGHFEWSKATKTVREDAEGLGMEVCFANSPLAIFVDKDFPRKKRFMFVEYGPQLSMIVDEEDTEATSEVLLSLGADFSMSFVYSLVNGTQVQEIKLTKKHQGFIDLDADGFFDVRITFDPMSKCGEIWYDGKWHEVDRDFEGWGKYQRKLLGGEVVSFKSGLWLSSSTNHN